MIALSCLYFWTLPAVQKLTTAQTGVGNLSMFWWDKAARFGRNAGYSPFLNLRPFFCSASGVGKSGGVLNGYCWRRPNYHSYISWTLTRSGRIREKAMMHKGFFFQDLVRPSFASRHKLHTVVKTRFSHCHSV